MPEPKRPRELRAMANRENPSLLLPGRALFAAALLYLVLGCGAFFSQPLYLIWFLAGVCVIPVALADALALLFFTDHLGVERKISRSLAQDEPARVTLYIRRNGRPLLGSFILLYDLYPAGPETAERTGPIGF